MIVAYEYISQINTNCKNLIAREKRIMLVPCEWSLAGEELSCIMVRTCLRTLSVMQILHVGKDGVDHWKLEDCVLTQRSTIWSPRSID